MEKPIDNSDKPTSKKTQLVPLSNNNESNPIIDGADKFVLFPLDVQETNPITQNSTTSQEGDFILFPLDVKKTSTNKNNPAPKTNQKPSKPKKQFVTKPNPQPIKGNPNSIQNPIPTPNPVNRTRNKKSRNIFWSIVICLSIYTCNKKESSESYTYFFSKSIDKFCTTVNKLKSNFINEDDFSEFKKGKKIIYSPYKEFLEDESGNINEVKGDSIIVIETTGISESCFYLPKGKLYKIRVNNTEFNESNIASDKIYFKMTANSYKNSNESRVNVYLDNGKFPEEISVYKNDIRFENIIEVRYMRNRFEDFKTNTILTRYISESLLNPKQDTPMNSERESKSNNIIGIFIKYEWIENDMFTFIDEKGNEIYFTDVPENCVLFNENGVNKNYYNKKFKIKWVVDNQSYEYPINKITQIELIK
jgi:hypothetical protein